MQRLSGRRKNGGLGRKTREEGRADSEGLFINREGVKGCIDLYFRGPLHQRPFPRKDRGGEKYGNKRARKARFL